MSRTTHLSAAATAVVGALVLSACAGGGSSDTSATSVPAGNVAKVTGTISLYGYSVAKAAYAQVIPGFTSGGAGQGVQFQQSYGASGDQSRKVAAGAPADVVSFSVEPDVTRLVKAGLVAADWDAGPDKGVPFGSVVTMVVRKGNPKGIHDWDDLLGPGISVVTPNPFSSGSAKWNLLAPYAVKSDGGTNPSAGLAYLTSLITQHVHVQPGSGREATETFLQGTGDVLLSYEDEAIAAVRAGDPVSYVTPPQTFKIENPVAVVTRAKNPTAATAFVGYLFTPAAQRLFAEAGFRPVDPTVAAAYAKDFPAPQKLWTISDLGGWASVDADLFTKGTGKVAVIYDKATK